MAVIQTFDFSSSTGWTLDSAMVWEIGTPTQRTAYDGDCLATDLSANYPDDVASQSYATSPVIDCSGYENVTMSFQRFAAFENTSDYDTFTIDVYDGSVWQTVFTSDDTAANISDTDWNLQSPDIGTYADDNANFRIRFGGESDGSQNYEGWFIDDLIIEGDATTNYQVEGVTYDKDGSILGTCKVALFKDNTPTDSFSFVDYTTSNASTGAYSFSGIADNDANYCVRAWKDNSPHVFDVTDYEILPKETPDVSWDLYLRSDVDKGETSPDEDLRLRSQASKVGPNITSAGDGDFTLTETNIVVAGSSFEASQGTGKLELGDSATYGSATLVTQSIDSWSDTSIQFDLVIGALDQEQLWLYVTTDGADVSAAFEVNVVMTPVVTSAGDEDFELTETDIVMAGSVFQGTQGTGKVELGDSATYGSATLVTQSIDSWADLSIQFDLIIGALDVESLWLYVTNDLGFVSNALSVNVNMTPTITDAGDELFETNETDIVMTGTIFESSQGTGEVELSNNSSYGAGTLVTQSIDSWADGSIQFDLVIGALTEADLYLFVTNDLGHTSDSYAVQVYRTPTITNIEDEDFLSNETDVDLTGTYFRGTQGTGKVELSDNSSYGSGTLVEQLINTWADGAINFDLEIGSFTQSTLYMFVTNSFGRTSTSTAVAITYAPNITDAEDESFDPTETGVVIDGTGFGSTQGTGDIELSDNASYGVGTLVSQSVNSWGDIQLNIDITMGGLSNGTVYFFVTSDAGLISSAYEVTVGATAVSTGLYRESSIVSSINDNGLTTTVFLVPDE